MLRYAIKFNLPGALRCILLEVDIELEALFEVEGQCSLAHCLLGLALALILGLALICSVYPREVFVYVLLREELAIGFSFDELLDMWHVSLCSHTSFESQLCFPHRLGGWYLIEHWLRRGFILYGHGWLARDLRLLVMTALHHDIRARGCDHLCLLLDRDIGRHLQLTHSLLHPFLTLDHLIHPLFLVTHRLQDSTVELVLLLQLALVRLHSQVLL